ncbi:MAG: hypothetical protein ACI93E_001343, partial [Flavobacteriales bacterium]
PAAKNHRSFKNSNSFDLWLFLHFVLNVNLFFGSFERRFISVLFLLADVRCSSKSFVVWNLFLSVPEESINGRQQMLVLASSTHPSSIEHVRLLKVSRLRVTLNGMYSLLKQGRLMNHLNHRASHNLVGFAHD